MISFLINKTGKFPILCKHLILKFHINLLDFLWNSHEILLFLSLCIVFILVVSGAGGILCMLSNIPLVQIYSFIGLMCCGMAVNVVNAATVELYPTASR